jgi:hypothetical protein
MSIKIQPDLVKESFQKFPGFSVKAIEPLVQNSEDTLTVLVLRRVHQWRMSKIVYIAVFLSQDYS